MNISLSSLFKKDWFGLLIVVLLSGTLISILKPAFISSFNLYVLMVSTSYMLIIALAQMIIIAIGQMNLSVGAIGGLVAISFSGLMEVFQISIPVAIFIGLIIGVTCGLFNGYITVKSGISAFIITLATLYIFKGINLGITEAEPFYEIPEAVKNFGNAKIGGTPIPYLIVIPIIITFLMWILMNRTETGRHMLAYGNSPQSAELIGISSTKVVITAHVISGLLAAIAGMLVVCRLQLGTPNIGDSWLLPSFAAPVIGGAILAGGKVDVIATALGVLVVAIISQALVIFNVGVFWVQIFLGLMILLAVFINRYREYQQENRKKKINHE
jgi:ribose transport system permease protein